MGNVDSSLLLLTYSKMTEDIIYTLKWKNFSPNVKSRVSDVIKEQSFCDVTLVSDDHKPFLAHRYVLSAFSPVLKDILLHNPHSHPLIYLRGVNHQELDSILQFIYFGKASVDHSNMKKFAQAAKDLKIKKLAENITMGNPPESFDDLDKNDDIQNEDISKDNEDQIENEYADIADKIIDYIPGSDEQGSGKQSYKCEECEVTFKHKKSLIRHMRAFHEGVKYYCDQCDYQATRQEKLVTHKKSVHDGVIYICDKCSYQTGWRQQLKEHKDRNHSKVPNS